jgi:IMP dehydrogenase
MTWNPVTLHQGITVREALAVFKNTKLRVLPVINGNTHVTGVVTLEDLGSVDVKRQEIDVCDIVMHKPAVMDEYVSLRHVAKFMVETQQDHVFVLDKENRLLGVISGIDVVKKIVELSSS